MPTIKNNSAISGVLAGGLFLFAPFALAQEDDTIVTTAPPVEEVEPVPTLPVSLESGLIVTDASGAETRVTFSGDGYFEAEDGTAGGWTMEDGFLCMAASSGNVNCTAMPEDAEAGASWSTTKADGSTISFEIPAEVSEDTEMPDGEGDGS